MSHPKNRAERRAHAERIKGKHREAVRLTNVHTNGILPPWEPVISDTKHPLDCGRANCGVCRAGGDPLDKRPDDHLRFEEDAA